MSFLRPSSLCHFLITYPSLRWMPCQSWSFLRWPGLVGFFRLLVVFLLWSMLTELRYIPCTSMYPTLCVGDRIIVEKGQAMQQPHVAMSQQQPHVAMSQQQQPHMAMSQQQPELSTLNLSFDSTDQQQHHHLAMSLQQHGLSASKLPFQMNEQQHKLPDFLQQQQQFMPGPMGSFPSTNSSIYQTLPTRLGNLSDTPESSQIGSDVGPLWSLGMSPSGPY